MGFSFNPLKGITRAFGIPDKARPAIRAGLDIGLLPIGVTDVAGTLLLRGVKAATAQRPPSHNITNNQIPAQFGPGSQPNIIYGAPNYGAPYYGAGGGFDAYGYQPTYNPYTGGSSWGYSTMYSQPSIQPFQGSSGPQDRTWEDLASLALPFFL